MRVILKNEMEAVDDLDEALRAWGSRNHIPKRTLHDICLALSELVSNIIQHGEGKLGESFIELDCEVKKDGVCIFLKDKGVAFNPLKYAPQDLTAKLEDREIGGLGIVIAKRMLDSLSYERRGGMNRLKMLKRFPKK